MVYLPHWPIPSTLGKRQIDYETIFERMEFALKKLGNPHQNLPPIIHVAGTNGKGSTSALISKIFSCAGYRTHTYTSPHLHDCNERITLAGEKISDDFLFEIMEEVRIAIACDKNSPPFTFMESFTIGAFLAFSRVPADVLIIECGMGGRIDATNILEKKLATVITPISFDHVEYLGNSLQRIALEKAMIMRSQTPLIVASQPKEAQEIIEILARDQNLETFFYDKNFSVALNEESGEFDLEFCGKIIENLPKPALLGSHQYINFATAIATILAISDKFQIEENHIRQAISNIEWPSRLEKIENNLNKILKNSESEIIIDGAHNEAGAFALARWITEDASKKTFVICGFSRGKCKKEFLEKFKNIADVVAVTVDGEPYPERSEVITKIGAEIGMKIFATENLMDALTYIAEICDYKSCRIVICGSLHLARDVRKFSHSSEKL